MSYLIVLKEVVVENRLKNAVNKSNYREVNHVFISVIKERFRFTFKP